MTSAVLSYAARWGRLSGWGCHSGAGGSSRRRSSSARSGAVKKGSNPFSSLGVGKVSVLMLDGPAVLAGVLVELLEQAQVQGELVQRLDLVPQLELDHVGGRPAVGPRLVADLD